MKIPAVFLRRLHWINFPTAALLALLQRTPVLRVIATAGEYALRSPAASVLKSAVATLASLGAVDTLVGATTLSASTPSPASATVGVAALIAYTVKGAEAPPASFTVGGNVPPGMTFSPLGASSGGIPSGIINASTIQLSGTPTSPGSFVLSIKGWEGPNGTLTSVTFNYTVNVAAAANTAPVFTTQPSSQSAPVSGAVVFFVTAAGSPAPTYQWQKNGSAIPNQTGSSLTLSNLTTNDTGSYTCVATNSFGSATSNAATLTVTGGVTGTLPAFTVQPAGKTISSGSTVVFSAAASGIPAPTYQWRKDGVPLASATSATLVVPGATIGNAGNYTCVATNAAGSVTSDSATLTVSSTSDFGRIINLSILTGLSSSEGLFTVGTVIGGSGTSGSKPFLIRAAGPTLGAAPFNIPGVLPNPRLDVFSGQTVVVSNDDWGGSAAMSNAFASVGAFPYVALTSKDAAVFSPTLAAGGYTMQVKDTGGASGTVIAELYDATPPASFTAATPRLINVSVLKQVPAGALLTAGFVIAGSTAKTVLIRAVGPTLTAFGVGGPMADPKLDLFSGQTVIASNDNWGGDTQLTTAGNAVGAFAIPNPSSKDAILLVTLAPGAYTVQASGAGGTSGQVLVEVYEVP